MAHGINVLSDSGFMQIDQDYNNLQLVTKQTVTVSTSFGNVGACYADVTLNDCVTPVVAVRCNQVGFYASSVQISGSGTSRTYRIYVAKGSGTSESASGIQVVVYHFDSKRSPAGTGYGLEVYGSDGTLAFSSLARPMRVVGLINSNSPNTLAVGGRTLAAVTSRHGHKIDAYAVPGTGTYYAAFFSAGTSFNDSTDTITASLYPYYIYSGPTAGAPSASSYTSHGQFLILDVTDF